MHRSHPKFTGKCADNPAGITRATQCMNKNDREATKRAEDAVERERAIDIRVDARADIRERNLKVQEAMAAESILSSKRKRAKANFTMLNSKIKVLEKYKDAYVEEHGEENYKKKLQELINALMASGEPDELPAPQMDKDEQMDKDDEDSDDNDNNDDHGS